MTTFDAMVQKRLSDLIDETLVEIEELKKSDRFSASEIDLAGPGDGIAGKPSNGKIEKDEDKEEDEKKKKDEEDKKEDMEKDEDSDKEEEKEEEKKEDEMDKAESKMPMPKGTMKMKKDEDKKDEDKEEKEEDKKEEMKKSLKASESLMKSYVDSKISPIESKLETIMTLVKDLAKTPVPSKSVSYKSLAPLKKNDEVETLSKSQVLDKLFDLKKSGTKVDTQDIISAELGSDLAKISNKYNIK